MVQSHALHHDQLVIFRDLFVLYVSAILYVLLLHENLICVTELASLADNVNVTFALFVEASQLLIEIVHVGEILSNIVDIVLEAVLSVHNELDATQAATLVVTVHCEVGVTVHLYTVLLTGVNKLIVQLLTLTSHNVKLDVASLNVHVTTKLVQLKYVHTLLVSVTDGIVLAIQLDQL